MEFVVNAITVLTTLQPTESLDDLHRFPDRHTVSAARLFNKNFQHNILSRYTGHTQDDQVLDQTLEETRHLYKEWDLLDDAQCSCYPPERRVQALKSLHLLLGEEAWQRGLMPPPVPLWRFRKMD